MLMWVSFVVSALSLAILVPIEVSAVEGGSIVSNGTTQNATSFAVINQANPIINTTFISSLGPITGRMDNWSVTVGENCTPGVYNFSVWYNITPEGAIYKTPGVLLTVYCKNDHAIPNVPTSGFPFVIANGTMLNPNSNTSFVSSVDNPSRLDNFTVNVTGPIGTMWDVYVIYRRNNSGDIVNYTTSHIYINITGPAVAPQNSCTYSSGAWIVQCSDSCNLSTNTNLLKNNITFNGTGAPASGVCRQETASIDPGCTNGATVGSYAFTNVINFTNASSMNDTDYTTFGLANFATNPSLLINYTLPNYPIINATWQINVSGKYGNFTLPSDCVSSSPVRLQIQSIRSQSGDLQTKSFCFNYTSSTNNDIYIAGNVDGQRVFEEGMFWYSSPVNRVTINASLSNFTRVTSKGSCYVTLKSGGKLI